MTTDQQGTVALVAGDESFPSFEAILDVTTAAAPHRDRKSLRRGVFHNSRRLDYGTWTGATTIRKIPDFDELVGLLRRPVDTGAAGARRDVAFRHQ